MATTSQRARTWPRIGTAALAVALLAAAGVVGWRVFAPAEVSTPARVSFPAPQTTRPQVRGTLPAAPLIVDDRIRVSATTRQVSADGPVDAKYRMTPYWSYRRWPAQLAGVLAVPNSSGGSLVVTQWSDGEVVALDARSGRIRWKVAGTATDQGYDGRRTGAATVYAPAGLRLAAASDNSAVLTVAGRTELWGLDPVSGRQLWRADVPATCRADDLTTTSGQLVAVDTCASPRSVEFRDAATGAVVRHWRPEGGADASLGLTGLGCPVASSGCPAFRTTMGADVRGWLADGATPVPAPALDRGDSVLIDDLAVSVQGTALVAQPVRGGARGWQREVGSGARILAVEPGRVHLLTPNKDLLTVNTAGGDQRSRFRLRYADAGSRWAPGWAYAAHGFVAVERLNQPVDPGADDAQYYAAAQPVILAVS